MISSGNGRWIGLVLVSLVVLSPRVVRADDNRIKIAAYNVEFFLDVFDDPYTHDEGHPPKPRKDIELVCKAVREVNPDVITFEEVENDGVMREAVKEFLPDMGYEYIAADQTNSDRGQNLGVISRKPIVSMTSHRFLPLHLEGQEQTWHFARDLWKVVIQATPTQTVTLFVVHLKSKYESDGDPHSQHWRDAEAVMARKIIGAELGEHPNEMAVMLGDFNDEVGSDPYKLLTGATADGKPLLSDVHSSLSKHDRGSYLRGHYAGTTIDYMLASPALFKHLVPGSAGVLHDDHVLGGSDHAPVYASFELGN